MYAREGLLVTEGLDRIHSCRAHGGINAEYDTDQRRYAECNNRRTWRNDSRHIGIALDNNRNYDPDNDTYQSSGCGQQNRLNKELSHNVALLGPQGTPDANLACPFGHRRQHNVHNANAPHQQANGPDGTQKDGQGLGNVGGGFQQAGLVENIEVVLVVGLQVVAQAQVEGSSPG